MRTAIVAAAALLLYPVPVHAEGTADRVIRVTNERVALCKAAAQTADGATVLQSWMEAQGWSVDDQVDTMRLCLAFLAGRDYGRRLAVTF